jgi:hypothetical protein
MNMHSLGSLLFASAADDAVSHKAKADLVHRVCDVVKEFGIASPVRH